jgi:hypothetical protein
MSRRQSPASERPPANDEHAARSERSAMMALRDGFHLVFLPVVVARMIGKTA